MKKMFTIPSEITRLKECSSRLRKKIVGRYFSLSSPEEKPPYFAPKDIIASHLERSEAELHGQEENIGEATEEARSRRHYAYTRSRLDGYPLDGRGGVLTEVCIGITGETLRVTPNLQVAAGFFSSMVASIDDLLDREGSFETLGERLFTISHAYRDLMELALKEELSRGTLTVEELRTIRHRLFEVTKTLVKSEGTSDPDRYLYEKSCGDKVIDVLIPLSSDGERRKGQCREIGRLVGEAGQLIDDCIDYDYDRAAGNKNYIIMKGSDIPSALDEAGERIGRAGHIAGELPSESMSWVIDGVGNILHILREHHHNGGERSSALLRRSPHLRHLTPTGAESHQLLVWF